MALGDKYEKGLCGEPMCYTHTEKPYTRVDEVKDLIALFNEYGAEIETSLNTALFCVYGVSVNSSALVREAGKSVPNE